MAAQETSVEGRCDGRVLLGWVFALRTRQRAPIFPDALLLEVALGVRLVELYPELYRECQELVLKRAHHLPDSARRSVLGRLLKEDITA
jgi:hypothetical protein